MASYFLKEEEGEWWGREGYSKFRKILDESASKKSSFTTVCFFGTMPSVAERDIVTITVHHFFLLSG